MYQRTIAPRLLTLSLLAVMVPAVVPAVAPAVEIQGKSKTGFRHAPPTELFEVARVVDGDTIHINRDGHLEKLRLLSVDTEERLSGRANVSPTKPETVFGEECALWAQEYFADLAKDGAPARVGLVFPSSEERRDVYDRLLCHVVLPDGTDFDLLLVQLGKSPYFNKYGNSLVCHEEFVAAQKAARKAKIGIWDPNTNRPKAKGASAAVRPYDRLLPWWQARAEAIDTFRRAAKADPLRSVDAESPERLAASARAALPEVEVFGQIYRIFDEDDGSRTVLFRSGDSARALRVRIAKEDVRAHAKLDLSSVRREFAQNFIYVKGRLVETKRGFEMRSSGPDAWRVAEPDLDHK
jgi:endonuclease YncB( thermonuclease family)